jgi:hypothetical protein
MRRPKIVALRSPDLSRRPWVQKLHLTSYWSRMQGNEAEWGQHLLRFHYDRFQSCHGDRLS